MVLDIVNLSRPFGARSLLITLIKRNLIQTLRAFRRPPLHAHRLGKLDDQEKNWKIAIFGFPNHQKSRFGGALGLSLGSLGASWAVFVRLGGALGVHWVSLGTSKGVLEASWAYLGASWGDFGRVLGCLGSLLGIFWRYFWRISCILRNSREL